MEVGTSEGEQGLFCDHIVTRYFLYFGKAVRMRCTARWVYGNKEGGLFEDYQLCTLFSFWGYRTTVVLITLLMKRTAYSYDLPVNLHIAVFKSIGIKTCERQKRALHILLSNILLFICTIRSSSYQL